MSAEWLPLVAGDPASPIAQLGTRRISRAQYLADVEALAAILPADRYGLNLCRNRYYFMVAFAALLVTGRINLLPHSAAPQVIDELGKSYTAWRIEDEAVKAVCATGKPLRAIPSVPADREAAVLFTSGSTGQPGAQIKTWGELTGSSRAALQRFGLESIRHDIVATVPPQHSYGFESSILYALNGAAVIHSGHPLFPADVCAALTDMQAPRVLVTTPLHLKACLKSGLDSELDWPKLAFALSATAPLSRNLAEAAETTLDAPMLEIYGSSETGAIASRRPTLEAAWTPYTDVRLIREGERFRVAAPFFPHPRALSDHFALDSNGCFEWHGRHADHIKIAGKRITLNELNERLLAIPGVEDGGFILPDGQDKRLAAVIVAPALEPDAIRAQLTAAIDPVFLPRPLIKVEALAHTGTGKVARAELLAHLDAHSHAAAQSS